MKQRQPSKPIKLGSSRFKQLQAKWYKLLKKEGFMDVERFKDLNLEPSSTMPRAHGPFIYDPDTDELDEDFIALADTDRAGYWREVGRAAWKLDPNDSIYELAHAYADEGTFVGAAQAVGMGRKQAAKLLGQWLQENDLREPGYIRHRSDATPPPEPAPVRTLNREEIARLNYTPPRSKK